MWQLFENSFNNFIDSKLGINSISNFINELSLKYLDIPFPIIRTFVYSRVFFRIKFLNRKMFLFANPLKPVQISKLNFNNLSAMMI